MKNEFKRYTYEIGNSVILEDNPCNEHCGCVWTKKKASFLERNKEYIIEDITYFGGGCPPVLLHLKDVKETTKGEKWWKSAIPANWFKPITTKTNT